MQSPQLDQRFCPHGQTIRARPNCNIVGRNRPCNKGSHYAYCCNCQVKFAFTLGHSLTMIEYTALSRKLPLAIIILLRKIPSCLAPRRSIARRLCKFIAWVRNSTQMQFNCSNAYSRSSHLHSVFTALRWIDFRNQIDQISNLRCDGSIFI